MSDFVLTSKTGTHPSLPPDDAALLAAQEAPYPYALAGLLARLRYRPGWTIALRSHLNRGQGSKGLTLVVTALVEDTYAMRPGAGLPPSRIRVQHYFPVPPAAYNERSWRHWLFRTLLDVEQHEAAEWFVIDGERPFAPLHAPGNDPYMVVEATYEEAHTSSSGFFDNPKSILDDLPKRPQ